MLSLTTGQLHDLLVQFTSDYPDCTINAIRVHDERVSIRYIDCIGECYSVEYPIRITWVSEK